MAWCWLFLFSKYQWLRNIHLNMVFSVFWWFISFCRSLFCTHCIYFSYEIRWMHSEWMCLYIKWSLRSKIIYCERNKWQWMTKERHYQIKTYARTHAHTHNRFIEPAYARSTKNKLPHTKENYFIFVGIFKLVLKFHDIFFPHPYYNEPFACYLFHFIFIRNFV